MSSDWRARLGSFAAGLGFNRLSDDFSDVERTETSEEAAAQTSRLRKVLDDLKAGDPNKGAAPAEPVVGPVAAEPVAVKPAVVEPVAVKPAVVEPVAVKPAVVEPAAVKPAVVEPVAVKPAVVEPPAKVVAPQPPIVPVKAQIEEKPKAEVANVTASAPILNGERKAETPMSDDVFLLVAQQRKAAEALLVQVAELEHRLQTEAHAAKAAADYAAAKEKAEAAAILELQANELAHAAAEHHSAAVAERREAEKLVASTRGDAEAAQAKIAQLQDQLRDARRLADQTLSALGPREARAKELASNEAAAQRKAAEAAGRISACQSARAEAEKNAEEARKRAETLKNALPPTQDPGGIAEVQQLSARIAQQAADVKRSREAIVSSK